MKFFWIILIVVGFVATYFLAQTSTTGNGIYYYLIYGWLLLIPGIKSIFPKLSKMGLGTINFPFEGNNITHLTNYREGRITSLLLFKIN